MAAGRSLATDGQKHVGLVRCIRAGGHDDTVSDAAIVGIIGLAVSAVIALGQTILANRRHAAELRHSRALGDRAELREVLDTAAQIIRRAMWGIDGIRAAFSAGDYDSIVQTAREGQRLAEDAALDNGRIALRLGREHEVYKRHDELMNVFIEMVQELMTTLPNASRNMSLSDDAQPPNDSKRT